MPRRLAGRWRSGRRLAGYHCCFSPGGGANPGGGIPGGPPNPGGGPPIIIPCDSVSGSVGALLLLRFGSAVRRTGGGMPGGPPNIPGGGIPAIPGIPSAMATLRPYYLCLATAAAANFQTAKLPMC